MGTVMTRPVSIIIHEQVYNSLREAAENTTKGSVSKYIRLLVYTELVHKGLIPLTFLEALYEKKVTV